MIIGNGMIAKNLSKIDNDNTLFFASGVSNSLCNDKDEFQREEKLLLEYINTDKKFIYFSSINEYIVNQKYLHHKLNIEKIIREHTNNFIILKIPQLIGNGGNENNFINFLYNTILNENEFNLIETKRSLLDIDDMILIIKYLLNINYIGYFNINYVELLNVTDFIDIIEKITNKKAIIKTTKKISQNISDNTYFVNDILEKTIDTKNYTEKLLLKRFR
jgi:UDP-2-acetamido-2,6-beta-L-arabino-hexul-4-ose reductase